MNLSCKLKDSGEKVCLFGNMFWIYTKVAAEGEKTENKEKISRKQRIEIELKR